MEYLELILIIAASVALFRQTYENNQLENKVNNLEGKLDNIEKLLIKLQPKSEPKIPVRLSKDVVKEVLANIDVEEINEVKETK